MKSFTGENFNKKVNFFVLCVRPDELYGHISTSYLLIIFVIFLFKTQYIKQNLILNDIQALNLEFFFTQPMFDSVKLKKVTASKLKRLFL